MSKLGNRMIQAANEALAYAKGDPVAGTIVCRPSDVGAIRKRLGLGQKVLAAKFGLPVKTIRD